MANAAHMEHPADRRYYKQLDAADRAEAHREAVAERLFTELVTTGSDDVDDECLLLALNADTLRGLYADAKAGKVDVLARLTAELDRAAQEAAEGEADSVCQRELRDAAEDRAEALAEARAEARAGY